MIPFSPTKSLVLKKTPRPSILVFFHFTIQVASSDKSSVISCWAQSIGVGVSASLSSEPGTRSLLTLTGLRMLMPFWMKVLSPQLTTWLPARTKSPRPKTSNLP